MFSVLFLCVVRASQRGWRPFYSLETCFEIATKQIFTPLGEVCFQGSASSPHPLTGVEYWHVWESKGGRWCLLYTLFLMMLAVCFIFPCYSLNPEVWAFSWLNLLVPKVWKMKCSLTWKIFSQWIGSLSLWELQYPVSNIDFKIKLKMHWWTISPGYLRCSLGHLIW